MATPTPTTRYVAHAAVGAAGAVVTQKLLGKGGFVVVLVGFLIVALLHEKFDASVAKAMVAAGLQL